MQHVQDMIVDYTDMDDSDFDMRIVDAESDDGILDYEGFDFDMTDVPAEDTINVQIQDLVDTENSGAVDLSSEVEELELRKRVHKTCLLKVIKVIVLLMHLKLHLIK
ncbi:hypothetical protein THIOSC13_930002 [uncultured Thiomicrorhabdus sp.]